MVRCLNRRPASAAVVAEQVQVVTGYRFFTVADPARLRAALEAAGQAAGILGTVLVAVEGVNLSVAGTQGALDRFCSAVSELLSPVELSLQQSPAQTPRPFRRLRVRQRREIVAFGRFDDSLVHEGARELSPAEWDALLAEGTIPVVDVRNRYEVAAGRFNGAIDPATDSFRDFPAWVDANLDPASHPEIAMYCTGGIRCSKAAAWLRGRGFAHVHELGGGILNYLAATAEPAEASPWQGECFVFDERVGLIEGLAQGALVLCPGCADPLTAAAQAESGFVATGVCSTCRAALDTGVAASRTG